MGLVFLEVVPTPEKIQITSLCTEGAANHIHVLIAENPNYSVPNSGIP